MAISPLRSLAAALVALAISACSQGPAPAPTPTPDGPRTPDASATGMLLDGRGVAMPLADAVRVISFRPFLPKAKIAAFAVLPPLGNEDSLANRGLAFEYVFAGRKLIVSEWPAQNFRIALGGRDASANPCTPVPYSHNGVVWTTPHGLVMTVQPDGPADAALIARVARALIAGGACR